MILLCKNSGHEGPLVVILIGISSVSWYWHHHLFTIVSCCLLQYLLFYCFRFGNFQIRGGYFILPLYHYYFLGHTTTSGSILSLNIFSRRYKKLYFKIRWEFIISNLLTYSPCHRVALKSAIYLLQSLRGLLRWYQ